MPPTRRCGSKVVDACVIALAERLDLHEVAALDRRDLQVVAPRHLPKGQRLKIAPGRLIPGTYLPRAAAVLIDATVVRGVLLQATLALLGDHTWHLRREHA